MIYIILYIIYLNTSLYYIILFYMSESYDYLQYDKCNDVRKILRDGK